MRTAAAVLALLVGSMTGAAQTKAPEPKKDENQLSPTVRLYVPKNLSELRARAVAQFVASVLTGISITWDDVPQALVIRVHEPADLDAAEAMLKRFDVPAPNTEMKGPERLAEYFQRGGGSTQPDCTVYLIRASTGAPRPGLPSTPVPTELQSAVDEMKRNFGYDHFVLWDAQQIAFSTGDFEGLLPSESKASDAVAGFAYVYSLSYKGAYYNPNTKVTTLNGFSYAVKMPIESHIKTDITLRDGQKLVLGKIRMPPAENADLFLVLVAKSR